MDIYTRRRLVAGGILAAIVLLVIALIAGGDDDDGTPEGVTTIGATTAGVSPLSPDQLAAEANLICEEADTALSELEATDEVELIRRQVEIATDELNQLRALQDSADDPAYDRFVAALRRHVRLLDRQAIATERGDGTAVAELQPDVEAAESRAAEAAEAAGLDRCAGDAGGADGRRAGEESGGGETPGTGGITPTPSPTEPAPAEPAPAPVEPAPAPPETGGGATPTPEPAPGGGTGGGGGGDTGGTTPGGTGGISP